MTMHMFIDEAGFDEQSPLYVLSVVTCEKPDLLREKINTLFEDIQHDPNLHTLSDIGRKDSFHYTEDHFKIRDRFIELLRELPFNSYVIFLNKKEAALGLTKETIHCELVKKILFDRLQENTWRDMYIRYENFDAAGEKYRSTLERELTSLMRTIATEQNEPVGTIQVIVADKKEPCLAIADYICGIVRAYIHPTTGKGSELVERTGKTYQELNYMEILGKIRVIYDYGQDTFYTRHTTKVIKPIM